MAGPQPDPSLSAEEVTKLRAQRKYLRHSLRFIWQMEDAVVVVRKELLCSSSTTDALEAIHFFVAALEFQLEPAKEGVRAMLALVWHKVCISSSSSFSSFPFSYCPFF